MNISIEEKLVNYLYALAKDGIFVKDLYLSADAYNELSASQEHRWSGTFPSPVGEVNIWK